MTLNVSVAKEFVLYLSPQGQPFFTTSKELFHILYRRTKLFYDRSLMGSKQYFELQREQWRVLNRPEQPCEKEQKRYVSCMRPDLKYLPKQVI